MTANHTPGPWEAVHLVETKYSPEHYEIQFGNDGECVAEYVHEPANARLIAAAPEMLAMLEDIDYALDDADTRRRNRADLKRIIAKARGQE